jgi:hypothetical protein
VEVSAQMEGLEEMEVVASERQFERVYAELRGPDEKPAVQGLGFGVWGVSERAGCGAGDEAGGSKGGSGGHGGVVARLQ